MCAKHSNGQPKEEPIPVDELDLDLRNPRLAGRGIKTQDELLRVLWEEAALDEIAISIAENGYFEEEPVFAVIEGRRHVVVEGNRRLATVKLLLSEKLRRGLRADDLPSLSAASRERLKEIPVITYPDRESLWAYVGFRHVNGPMTWDSWSKAQYIAQVRNSFKVKLEVIAQRIGDNNQTVKRLYRGLMVCNQAVEKADYNLDDRRKAHFSFSHLYTGLDYAGFEQHLGMGKEDGYEPNPVKKPYLKNLRELMVWLFGSKEDDAPPVVRSQNPDLKRLDDVLRDRKALSALRSGLGLNVAHEISLGDEVRFRDTLTKIKYDLQQARGLVLQGFKGEKDLLATARDIHELSGNLLDEMVRPKPRGGG